MYWILCLLIIAPLIQIVLSILKINNKIRLPLWFIGLLCLVLGIGLSWLAMYIDMVNLPPGTKCATPSVGIIYLGFLITIVTVPLITLVCYFINYRRKKLVV